MASLISKTHSSSSPSSYSSSLTSWRGRSSSSASDKSQSSSNLQGSPSLQKSGFSSSNWLNSPSPDAIKSKTPSYEDIALGTVFFLSTPPPSNSIIHEKLLSSNQNSWEHPAVITGKFIKDGKQCVYIRLCSTFGGRRVEDHKRREHWRYHILTDNETDANPHDGSSLARMAPGSGKFQKRTYVNISPEAEYPI